VVSFKLFYYYTYLVIGLALLGIGSGAVLDRHLTAARRARTDTILMVGSPGRCRQRHRRLPRRRPHLGRVPVDLGLRHQDSVVNFAAIVAICLALFASFVGSAS
jgi:hypothetical protein